MAKKNHTIIESESFSSSGDESLPPTSPTAMKSTADSGFESDDFDSPLNSIASKQAEDRSKAKKSRSRPNSKPSSSPTPKKTPAKRPAATTADKDTKKSKTAKGAGEEEGKKSVLFQRLWSDDDEVAILKGMLEYKEQKGLDPMEEANDFHEFIKSSVHFNVDKRQLVDKVRRLKKRFKNSKTRKTFNPHETIVIELCNKIWGQKVESNMNTTTSKASKNTATTKSAGNAKLEEPAPVTNGSLPTKTKAGKSETKTEVGKSSEGDNSVKFLGKTSIAMGLDEAVVAAGLSLSSEDRKAELEKKWKKLHVEESDLFLKKLDLAREESEMIIAALRSGA